jgi:hypothetical protein
MTKANVYNCSIIELPKIHNRAGNITSIEGSINVPFDIERIYYLYDMPGGESRGGHAHKELQQLIVALSGSFDVLLDDGINKRTITLNRPYFGLYVSPMMWRELTNFSSGGVCMVLASMKYSEDDYIREYQNFKSIVEGNL